MSSDTASMRYRPLVFVTALAILVVACDGATQEDAADTTERSGTIASTVETESSLPATTSSTTVEATAAEVEAYVTGVGDFVSEWNANQLRWVTAYSDESVSWEDFLSEQHQVQVDQAGLLGEFEVWIGGLGAEYREAAAPLLAHYHERFQVLRDDLFPATVAGDDAAFQAAGEKWMSLQNAETIVPVVESALDVPDVVESLEEEGLSLDEFVEVLTGLVPGDSGVAGAP